MKVNARFKNLNIYKVGYKSKHTTIHTMLLTPKIYLHVKEIEICVPEAIKYKSNLAHIHLSTTSRKLVHIKLHLSNLV